MERFTAVFEHIDDWWIGFVEELPGANTQGKTLEETRGNLKEAVQLIIAANREIARRGVVGKHIVRSEIKDILAGKICKDLGIPGMN